MAVASSDAGRTDSSALTAFRLPFWYRLRQLNTWLAFTQYWQAAADTDAPGTSVFLRDSNFLCWAPPATFRLGRNLDGFHVMTRLHDSHKTTRYLRE